MKRQSGYYWVKYNDQWFIGNYSNITDSWQLFDEDRIEYTDYKDTYFQYISALRIPAPYEELPTGYTAFYEQANRQYYAN